jgi:excisionase family DNA binding protein
MDKLYTTYDVANLLQVDASTVSKWIDRSILLAFRTPGGHRRVRAGDLRNFLISHQMPVPAELGIGMWRLVIVDDSEDVLAGLRRAFKPHSDKVDVITTTSGVEAVLLVSELVPAGLLLDLKIPDLDGLEVCRRLRARKSMDGLTLITMTSKHTPEAVAASRKAGAVACLPKPVQVDQVLELLRTSEASAPGPRRGP